MWKKGGWYPTQSYRLVETLNNTRKEAMQNVSVHQLLRCYKPQLLSITPGTTSVTWYMLCKLASTKTLQNFWIASTNTWTRLLAFYMALIPSKKLQIKLFSLQLRVNSKQTELFHLGMTCSLEEGNLYIQPFKTPTKNWTCVASCSREGVGWEKNVH